MSESFLENIREVAGGSSIESFFAKAVAYTSVSMWQYQDDGEVVLSKYPAGSLIVACVVSGESRVGYSQIVALPQRINIHSSSYGTMFFGLIVNDNTLKYSKSSGTIGNFSNTITGVTSVTFGANSGSYPGSYSVAVISPAVVFVITATWLISPILFNFAPCKKGHFEKKGDINHE